VDNSSSRGRQGDDPGTETGVELGSREGSVVHTPSESVGDGAGVPSGIPRRGADLARDALEAARVASAARRAERGADPRRVGPRRSGASGIGRPRRRGWSGARADERDPQALGRLASRLSGQRGWAPKLAHGSVFGRWAELVGAEVAEHATPTALRDGELTVEADSTAWATQLRLLQRTLLARLAAGLGPGVVTKMRIHGPSAPSWRRGPRHVSGRGPRDTYG
jgi:predicted nucleic acid-binding Zn ribbon protein